MRRLICTAALLPMSLAGCVGAIHAPMHHAGAIADLVDANGKAAGRAIITQSADGLWIEVTAKGLTPGDHGFHVHAVGTCTAPDFASAGPHWNPSGHQHGRKNPQGTHAGDAPNLRADASGKARLKTWLGAGSITGGATALLDADGAAIVIHADPDDEMTDPSGKSGKRLLCGVLRAR